MANILSLLSRLRMRRLYRTEFLHPPGHPVTTAVFCDTIKGTLCINYNLGLASNDIDANFAQNPSICFRVDTRGRISGYAEVIQL